MRDPAYSTLAFVLVALCAPMGCEMAPAPPAPPPPPPTAAERFNNFFTTLKSKIDDPAIRDGAAISNYGVAPGTPLTDWTTTVSHEYFEAEGDTLPRAVVTLTTRSTVTVVLPPTESEDDSKSKPKRPGDGSKPEGYAEIEALVSKPAPNVSQRSGSAIQTLPGEEVTKLRLEYRGDEWVLLTELDDTNEPFTSSAIRYALKRQ